MGRWTASLDGEPLDLDTFVSIFQTPAFLVTHRQNGEYILTSTDFLDSMSADEVFAVACELIDLANGALRLEQKHFPVSVDHVSFLRSDGTRHHTLRPLTITVPGIYRTAEEKAREPSADTRRSATAIVTTGRANPHVAEVLRELSTLAPDFPLLSRILETIEADVGGEDAIIRNAWVSRRSLKLFARTANTIGRRHAPGVFRPPKKPMPLSDARTLIKRIAKAWLRDKYGIS